MGDTTVESVGLAFHPRQLLCSAGTGDRGLINRVITPSEHDATLLPSSSRLASREGLPAPSDLWRFIQLSG
jgi:hypothetical protein